MRHVKILAMLSFAIVTLSAAGDDRQAAKAPNATIFGARSTLAVLTLGKPRDAVLAVLERHKPEPAGGNLIVFWEDGRLVGGVTFTGNRLSSITRRYSPSEANAGLAALLGALEGLMAAEGDARQLPGRYSGAGHISVLSVQPPAGHQVEEIRITAGRRSVVVSNANDGIRVVEELASD